ncbi:MAG: hypothetical protein L0229_22340 [Blastocatellia bacterium]|nr:hypothetical protein [Blastocatellia bacterium]
MTSKSVSTSFIASLILLPVAFALAITAGGASASNQLTLVLFGATVLVEVLALFRAVSARKLFSSSDLGYITWTLIAAFLVIRLIAEARLVTLNFNLAPKYVEDSSEWIFFYVIVLRYLYTLSDLLFVGALAATIRAYKSTGLKFGLMGRDYLYILLLWTMPVLAFVFKDNLFYSHLGDSYITTYRLVAVTVGTLIASLCIVVRRYASQMGGGAIARVWNMVVSAGIARTASFVALALMTNWWRPGALFFEQYLLWIFACCWLMAAIYQQQVLPRAIERPVVVTA